MSDSHKPQQRIVAASRDPLEDLFDLARRAPGEPTPVPGPGFSASVARHVTQGSGAGSTLTDSQSIGVGWLIGVFSAVTLMVAILCGPSLARPDFTQDETLRSHVLDLVLVRDAAPTP